MSRKASLKLLIAALVLVSCSKGTSVKSSSPKSSDEEADSSLSGDIYQSPGDGSVGGSGVDPLAFNSWHLRNYGQNSFSKPLCVESSCTYGKAEPGEDSGLGNSHDRFNTGEGVRIAISDNGTDIYHEDLYFNIEEGLTRNYSSDDPNEWLGVPTPAGGSAEIAAHGTAVTGIIGAIKNNSRGSFGIAPNAKLVPFKYVGTSGSYAKEIDQAGGLFDIFNYSYGRSSCSYHYSNPSYLDALKYGVQNLRAGKGALYVKAAGNEYISSLSDCSDSGGDYYLGNANFEEENSYPYLIVTAAMNAAGKSSTYSTPGSSVWLSAPAGEFGDDSPAIVSTDLMDCNHGFSQNNAQENSFESGTHPLNSDCNYTSTMNGTSSAAPMVSGAIALILAERPELTWRDVKDILARSARQIDASNMGSNYPVSDSRFPALSGHRYQEGWITNAAGFKFHNWYGFGALDIEAALELARSRATTMPAYAETLSNGNWKYLKSLSRAIPDFSAAGTSDSQNVTEDLIAEQVQVRLSVDHTRASDLGVELTSPTGTKSQLMLINSNIVDKKLNDVIFLSNAFYGENAKGQWTLKVLDGRQGESGTLTRWGVHIFGHAATASPEVLSESTLAHQSSLTKKASSPEVYVNSAVGVSARANVLTQKRQSAEASEKSKAPKSPSRLISSVSTQLTGENPGKHKPTTKAQSDALCLVTRDSEVTLTFNDRSATLPGTFAQVGLLALHQKGDKIVLAMRSADEQELAKTLVFDQHLNLIDESFLEGEFIPYDLSMGIFAGEKIHYLTGSGLAALLLEDLNPQSLFEEKGLHSLKITANGSVAQTIDGSEELTFDAAGVIFSRTKREKVLSKLQSPQRLCVNLSQESKHE